MRTRRLPHWFVAGVLLVAPLVTARSARADDTSVSTMMAQALFEEGTALLSRGDLEPACRKLAESHRLSPAGGTVYNLAVCLEQRGKTASAYVAYDEALARATRDGVLQRQETIRARLVSLKPRLVRFVVRASVLANVDVRLDGERMRPETWNTAVPVDPGPHDVDVHANGRVIAHQQLTLDEAGRLYEWQVPTPKPAGALRAPTAAEPTRNGATKKKAATALMVTGGLLVATGAVFGAMAIGAHGTSNDECPAGPNSCSGAGVRAEANAKGYAWGANVGFGAGLIALATGAVLLFVK